MTCAHSAQSGGASWSVHCQLLLPPQAALVQVGQLLVQLVHQELQSVLQDVVVRHHGPQELDSLITSAFSSESSKGLQSQTIRASELKF